ncbi:hypothetical protein SERLA73DRAFT_80214 [Serpula lacrymans var. lacrymans S7.3]|uniref:F-box domain-containing protein n=2 Tax=Serpula lacrymans var. lacrymans TaxID=341189 RepID=F8QJ36_SERL3|nr:uncharacterized protein SERLADRAFT_433960 [Serpula lacrymans var. lacrymans S7.9]EGN91682.1 hypothetical protein SERLA73DRAFT_80214 [Serpula lacrymans var. lacrymans S7.3]EGO30029.1 hypothetical protein SERLADRAFT_433960 [Serpula lacrymans var. lacrymans S7.9]
MWPSARGKHKAFIDPIATLPNELLVAIFAETIRHAYDAPVRISHVCSHWRRLALCTPALWTIVPLVLSKPVQAVQERIRRSGQRLLEIHGAFGQDDDSIKIPIPTIEELLDVVITHSHRWRLLHITVMEEEDANIVLDKLKPIGVPRLVSFILKMDETMCFQLGHDQDEPIELFSGGAPKLTSLHLANVRPGLFCIPSATLTSYTLFTCANGVEFDVVNLADVLGNMPALSRVVFQGDMCLISSDPELDQDQDDNTPSPPLKLQALRFLEIEGNIGCTAGDMCKLLAAVCAVAPGIQDLVFTTSRPLDSFQSDRHSAWQNLFEKHLPRAPFPAVRSLVLHYPITTSSASAIFNGSPHLEYLSLSCLNDQTVIRSLIEATRMISSDSQSSKMPSASLKTLVLDDWSSDYSLLFELLRVRKQEGVPLDKVIICSPDSEFFDTFPVGLRNNLEKLVTLELGTSRPPVYG